MGAAVRGRGPGAVAQPGTHETWGGRRAQAMVRATLATYGDRCWLCGLPGATTADHVIPIASGGAVYDLANLGPAHGPCNYSRGARPAELFELIEDGAAWFTEA